MSDSVRPQRRQPTRLPRPWDSPGNTTGVGCHFLLQCMQVKSESEVVQSGPTLSDPWTAAYQASPSMGFSRQEYWSGVPLPSPTEEPGRLQSVGSQRVRHKWWLSMHSHAKWQEYFCDTLPFKCDDNSLHMGQRRSVTKLLSLRILWVKTIANTENQSHSSSMWSLQVTLNMGI